MADCLRPGVLEQVKEFLPTETPTLVYGNHYLMKQKIYNGKKYRNSDFMFGNICHQAIFYHRAIFDIIGKYDLQYKVFADWIFNLKCFIHQGISKQYIPCLIADFEEGGLSSVLNNDLAFKKDFPRFVKKQLGIPSYLKCKAFMINPTVYSFSYGASNALRRHLISFARPYVHGYRYLRKVIRNKI